MISFIVPTTCRPSLVRTLASIECIDGDEILLVSDMSLNLHMQSFVTERPEIRCIHCPPGKDWGHTERNVAQQHARGEYIAHIDDDDWYMPGTRDLMADAITKTHGLPIMFRMRFPCGITLWRDPKVYCGNVGTPMFLIPNHPEKFGTWGSFVGGDCSFLETSKWPLDEYVFRPEVIALLDHDPGVAP